MVAGQRAGKAGLARLMLHPQAPQHSITSSGFCWLEIFSGQDPAASGGWAEAIRSSWLGSAVAWRVAEGRGGCQGAGQSCLFPSVPFPN